MKNLIRSQNNFGVLTLAAFAGIMLIMPAFFQERLFGTEEPTLFNAVYTAWKTSKTTFPVYTYWMDACQNLMYVHPPLHYWLIAQFMKLNIPLFYAEALPCFLFGILSIYLIVTMPIEETYKISSLLALMAFLGFWSVFYQADFSFHLRPDFHLALAWFSSLLLLEKGKRNKWDLGACGCGAFVALYAAGLHYFGWIGILVPVPYLIVGFLCLGFRKGYCLLLAMAAGALLFLIPYWALFLRESADWIIYLEQGSRAAGNLLWTIQQNFLVYQSAANQLWDLMAGSYPLLWYCYPLFYALKCLIPPWVVTLFILRDRSLRTFGFAASPIFLGYFFLIRRKSFNYMGPEILLFFLVIFGLLLFVFDCLFAKLFPRLQGAQMQVAAGLCLAILIVWGTPTLVSGKAVQLGYHGHELFLARSAAKKIVGENAMVAAQHPVWFVSGADTWVDLTKDILWELPREPIKNYLSYFDSICYLAASWMGTQTGWNEARLLQEGLLFFQGFYKTKNNINQGGYIFLAPKKPEKILGFYWKEGALKKFQEKPDGNFQLSILTKIQEADLPKFLNLQNNLGVEVVNYMYLPESAAGSKELIVLILERSKTPTNQYSAKEIKKISGTVSTIDPYTLFSEDKKDKTINFVQTQAEAAASRCQKIIGTEKRESISFSPVDGNAETNPTGIIVRSGVYDKMATSNILYLKPDTYYLIEGQLTIRQGGAALAVNDAGQDKPFLSLKRGVAQKKTTEKFLVWSGKNGKVQLTVSCLNHFQQKKTVVELQEFSASRAQ